MNRRARSSVDITDFRVGQHVLFARDNGEHPRKGVLTVIDPQRPFPATVTFDDGFTERALPWELTSVPASRNIDDVERWLNER